MSENQSTHEAEVKSWISEITGFPPDHIILGTNNVDDMYAAGKAYVQQWFMSEVIDERMITGMNDDVNEDGTLACGHTPEEHAAFNGLRNEVDSTLEPVLLRERNNKRMKHIVSHHPVSFGIFVLVYFTGFFTLGYLAARGIKSLINIIRGK